MASLTDDNAADGKIFGAGSSILSGWSTTAVHTNDNSRKGFIMRYSMLVYITNMGKTLLDAAGYLQAADNAALKEELYENGRIMLERIERILTEHRGDLRSASLMERLQNIRRQWETGRTYAALQEELPEWIRRLPGEIDYRVRVAFFAELGEKWDSLESVYEFMRDDPRFDPVVVLTPVFRMANVNGEQRQEVIYSDYLTRLGIPFLGYSQYSLEKDCPDLALICQPYESCTLPQFWPEHIAAHTRLVYIPYFLTDIVLEQSPKELCQLNVYDVSWRGLGSSQKHYEYYRRYSRCHGQNMLVTGIPKMDPIIKAAKNGAALPGGWEKIKDKKVFLWNTWYDISVSSVRFFNDIFKWFQEHEDCALIWRPHPMTETVTKVHSPEHYSFLQHCIQCVTEAPNAILDQESSFLASFVYSDAQFSDLSSMMPQYLPMDKPLLWIDVPVLVPAGEEFISTEWMEYTDNFQGIIRFLEQIRHGSDPKRELRAIILQRDLPLADGRCGERVSLALWKEMHEEDELL